VALVLPLGVLGVVVGYLAGGGLERDLERAWSAKLEMPGSIALGDARLAGFGRMQLADWRLFDDDGRLVARVDELAASSSEHGRVVSAEALPVTA